MTKAEKNAIKSRTNELINKGIDKEIAKILAKAEFDTGLIAPVVNGNYADVLEA